MLGQLVDERYQVIQVLSAGGFGQTYVAQDTKIPSYPTCVVKQLKPASSDPKVLETARQLFQSEAEILMKLGDYEQIPQLLAYNDQDFYLVQEFIEGHPLSTELPPGQRWDENQVIQMLQEVLGILVVIHSLGVIHRDIKPDNIIRRARDSKLVLIDFGAIKQVRSQLLTEQGQISDTVAIDTLGYRPTEQKQGKPHPNSDIYALGMVGIQALTGLYPHQLEVDINTNEIIWQHQTQVSPALASVLTKMVRSHFKDRYQSATEALHALQELINLPYPPTEYAMQQESTPQEPVAPDLQSPSDSELSTAPSSTAEPLEPLDSSVLHSPAVATASSKLALLLSVSVAAFVSSVGGLGLITNSATNSNPPSPAKVAKSPVGQLPAFTQLPESCSAFVTGNLRSEPTSLQDNIVDSVSEKLDVTGKQTSTGWIEVKRPNGNLVWAHRDVIPNQGEIDTCLQTQGIPVQIVDVSPQPVSPPQTNNGTQPADGSTSPPQTNNGTQPADGSTSPAQTNNSTQPADGSTSPAQTNNSTQPADGSTSPAQTNNGTQPTNGSTSPAQTNNANQPADGSTSPIQTNNANQPADGSTSPIQPNNANQPADSSNPSSNSSENLN